MWRKPTSCISQDDVTQKNISHFISLISVSYQPKIKIIAKKQENYDYKIRKLCTKIHLFKNMIKKNEPLWTVIDRNRDMLQFSHRINSAPKWQSKSRLQKGKNIFLSLTWSFLVIWNQVFKNGPGKIFGRHPSA